MKFLINGLLIATLLSLTNACTRLDTARLNVDNINKDNVNEGIAWKIHECPEEIFLKDRKFWLSGATHLTGFEGNKYMVWYYPKLEKYHHKPYNDKTLHINSFYDKEGTYHQGSRHNNGTIHDDRDCPTRTCIVEIDRLMTGIFLFVL